MQDPKKRNSGIVVRHQVSKSKTSRDDPIFESWKDNDFYDERDDFPVI